MKQLTQERTTQGIATIITLLAVLIIGSVVAVSPTQTTAQDSIRLYDGDLIKSPSNPDVYIVKYINNKWFKRLILNPEIFNSYGHLSWDNIKTVNQDTIDNHTTSNLVIEVDKDGTPVNGRVYYLTSAPNTDTGIKHHLNITAQEFSNLGLDWDSIYKINNTEAGPTFYKTGTAVTVSNFDAVIQGAIPSQTVIYHDVDQRPYHDIDQSTDNTPVSTDQNGDTSTEDTSTPTNQDESISTDTDDTSTPTNQDESTSADTGDTSTSTDSAGTDTDSTPQKNASFRATLSGNIANVEINEDEQKEVAEFTLRSSDADSTIEDITFLFRPRGSALKDHELSDTFTDIELLLGGSVVQSSTTVREVATGYRVNFNLSPNVVIKADTTEQLTVRVRIKETPSDSSFQKWSVSMDHIDLKGTYAEEYKTSAARIFTVDEKKIPFITINDKYNHYVRDQVVIQTNRSEPKATNLLFATFANRTPKGEDKRAVILDSLTVDIEIPSSMRNSLKSISLLKTGSKKLGTIPYEKIVYNSVAGDNLVATVRFTDLNHRIQSNSSQIISVRADIQMKSVIKNAEIKTTIRNSGVGLRYSTNKKPVEDEFIAGTAKGWVNVSSSDDDERKHRLHVIALEAIHYKHINGFYPKANGCVEMSVTTTQWAVNIDGSLDKSYTYCATPSGNKYLVATTVEYEETIPESSVKTNPVTHLPVTIDCTDTKTYCIGLTGYYHS